MNNNTATLTDARSIEILTRWRDEHTIKAWGADMLARMSTDANEIKAHREVADYHRQQADCCTQRLASV